MFHFVRRFHPKIGDEVATIDDNRFDQSIDHTILQDRARSTFDKAVADIETKINRTKTSVNTNVIDNDDDIFPSAAKDMGSGKINIQRICSKKLFSLF